jgi:hypothetical protein
MVNSDVLLRQGDYEDGSRAIVNHIHFWEQFFDQNELDVLVMYVTAYRVGRTAYAVARTMGIPHLIIQTGVIHNTFSLCDRDEGWVWSELLDGLETAESASITSEAETSVRNLVKRVSAFKDITKPPEPSWKAFAKLTLQNIARLASCIEWNEWLKVYRQILWWKISGFRLAYDPIREDEKYAFFPLHAPWDAQILTRNPLYYNQFELVRQVALSLPVGYYLYVKEHPYNAGGEPLKRLRAIQRIHNVRVIDPRVNSKLLIQGSRTVFVINGTAGWEAFLFKKPVVVVGRPFYKYSSLVYSLERSDSLPDAMRAALTEGAWRYETETDKWLGFIHHAIQTCYPGNPWGYKSFWRGTIPADLTDENVRHVAEGIHGKIERMLGGL